MPAGTSSTEEIKNRVDIADFIGAYVQLKRAGANFKARCPFHNEKTPSFMVSKAKQLWYCFGACNEGGDIFKFLMKIEGLDFPEALKILADKAGVALPRYDKRAESKKNTLLEIVKAAAEFYAAQLHEPHAKAAKEYLKARGLSEEIIRQFNLGYAPDAWDSLTSAFRDKFSAPDVFDAGLTIRKERTVNRELPAESHFYDRFRHRIMFPIHDLHGNPIGFTSRLLDERRQEGKYINTPETLIYSKSRVLYGFDLARQSIRQQDCALIVEGNMDVIACHQFGQTSVVASSGTALTLDQVRLLKRHTNNLKIAFDADLAGENAAKRGIDIALGEEMRVKVITIPPACGKDPDECIRKDKRAWESAMREAKEIMEYYIEKARVKHDLNTAHGRSQFSNLLLAEVLKLPDLIAQDFWIKKIAETVKIEERLLREQLQKIRNRKFAVRNSIAGDHAPSFNLHAPSRSRADLLSPRLLALFLHAPKYAERIIGSILPEMLMRDHRELYVKLAACYTAYNSQKGSDTKDPNFRQFWRDWAAKSAPEMLSTADILELYGDKEFEGWELPHFEQEAGVMITELRREYVKKRGSALAQAMRQAETAGDKAQVEALGREFSALNSILFQ